MKYFQQLAHGVNITPLLHSVQRQPDLWDQCNLRKTHQGSPHTQVSDILLRFIHLNVPDEEKTLQLAMDQHESINYPAFAKLPQARPIVFDLMRLVEGERLGRVMITKLAPGKIVAAHVDSGDHAAYFDRYHCMLQNQPGSLFRAGDETVTMKAGDIWWFDNSAEHEVVNNSSEDRITMIIDIRTTR